MQYRPGVRLLQYLAKQRNTEELKTVVKTIDYALVEEQYTYRRIDALSIEQEIDVFNLPKEEKEKLQARLVILQIQMGVYEKILKIAPDKRWVKGTTLKQVASKNATIIS